MLEAVSNSRKGAGLPFLVPLLAPGIRADTVGILPQGLAFAFVTRLLDAQKPLVVAIPAVKSLVLGREAFVTGSGTNLLDHGENSSLLLVHLRSGSGEDLERKGLKDWLSSVSESKGTISDSLTHLANFGFTHA